ncbi:MAG: hypothetical protein EKK64_03040 [Neisseriaceae bacterium]|nr:MAG: hypothetical protein EKK64_03040 [Neisseriaceae bacterium]
MYLTLNRLESEINGYVLIECPPCRRMVNIDGKNYYLSFPKMLFRINYIISKSKKFTYDFSRNFFYDGEFIYNVPLYNINISGLVCLGNKNILSAESVEDLITKYLNTYWKCEFSSEDDYCVSWDSYSGLDMKSFKKWQEKTRADSNWIPSASDLVKSNYSSIFFKKTIR